MSLLSSHSKCQRAQTLNVAPEPGEASSGTRFEEAGPGPIQGDHRSERAANLATRLAGSSADLDDRYSNCRMRQAEVPTGLTDSLSGLRSCSPRPKHAGKGAGGQACGWSEQAVRPPCNSPASSFSLPTTSVPPTKEHKPKRRKKGPPDDLEPMEPDSFSKSKVQQLDSVSSPSSSYRLADSKQEQQVLGRMSSLEDPSTRFEDSNLDQRVLQYVVHDTQCGGDSSFVQVN